MKKLSLIAGLACLATIGGVFGAWTFGSAGSAQSDSAAISSITVETDVQTKGDFTASVDEVITGIAYKQEAHNSYIAVATPTKTADVYTITVSDDGATTAYTYGATLVLGKKDQGKDGLSDYIASYADKTLAVTPGVDTATFTVAEIVAFINNIDIKGDETGTNQAANKAYVDAFAAALANTTITINVTVTGA